MQPFTVKVHPDVPFLCDLHAHLADSEIIGFLAGRFDREAKCLYIQVRGAPTTQSVNHRTTQHVASQGC